MGVEQSVKLLPGMARGFRFGSETVIPESYRINGFDGTNEAIGAIFA
jgi:hypothetical protein